MCELFIQPGGLASVAVENAQSYASLATFLPKARPWIASFLLVGFGSWTTYLVLLLKSFIYNVYQVTTTSVAFEWAKQDQAARDAAGGKDSDAC